MKAALVCLLAASAWGAQHRASVKKAPSGSEFAALGQQIVQMLVSGDFSGAEQKFDDKMKAALPEDKLRTTWTSVAGQVGPFQNQLGVKVEKVREHHAVNVKCAFQSANLTVRVVVGPSKQVTGLFFIPDQKYSPPAYVNASAFQEREVVFGTKGWMVHGAVTVPAATGPFPAVVLVHGSGPNDRDETLGPNKPFRDLAWGLATQRIAVLRYEKRTMEHSAQAAGMSNFTVKEETIEDAVSAVGVLRNTERVDGKRIFVLGHSLGGTLAPWIARTDPGIAGMIVMAGATRPLEDVIVDQYTYLASLGLVENNELAKIQEQAARVKDPRLSSDTPKETLLFGVSAPYWLALRGYNPPEVARRLAKPMLILQGERDYQVTMQDFAGWKSVLSSGVAFRSYPSLNHLFMEGQGTKARPEEYEKPGHVSQTVVEDIANWINAHR